MRRSTVQILSRLHVLAFRATGGRLGSRIAGIDVLLLTTTGNRTGATRIVPLLYLRDGLDYIVVASYGGRPHHPDWYLNLLADPEARVRVDGEHLTVHSSTLSVEERKIWWKRAVADWSDYEEYQGRTTREIPLVRLTPVR
ncbi:MAG: nitroreductase family deazaflavin-dependent oxidoreductase [Actinomycetota bacterium]|nr:nitroreductase family deazaflavin-dependent oxidoreductase [Actinomycetota bacterium]